MKKQMEKDWETWWNNEGSGMRPKPGEEIETFAKRMTRIAWANGAYIELKRLALLGAHGGESEVCRQFAIRECAKMMVERSKGSISSIKEVKS